MWRSGTLALAASLLAAAPAWGSDPAEQPPFDGQPVPPLVKPARADVAPPGFGINAEGAIEIADGTEAVRSERDQRPLHAEAATRGHTWQVDYFDAGGTDRAQVVIADPSGRVLEAWTGHQVETKLARGYEDAVARDVNEAWIWLPLCVLFLLPFFDFRRPLRWLHFDLLALLAFSASLFFFNRGEIDISVPLVYPVLGYLFVRMLIAARSPLGERERRDRLIPHLPLAVLAIACIALAGGRIALNVVDSSQIDVGYAGVIGADRLADGEDVYGPQFPEGEDIRGDVYGPFDYIAYVPFEQLFPTDGDWEGTVAAQHAAAIAFDLLCALGLLLLGLRLRPGGAGRELGIALCFAWLAYPFTTYALNANTNDALVAAMLVLTLLAFGSALARGALAALGGMAKYGTLALAPLFAPGDGSRRTRSTLLFALAFTALAVAVTLPLIPDGGLREIYDRSLGYQASRGSPFSVWGLDPSLETLQTAAKLFAIGLALVVFFVPRRRDVVQVAALSAAVVIALQVASEHWFYFYALWFAPPVLIALFSPHAGPQPAVRGPDRGRDPAVGPPGERLSTPGQ